MPTIKLPTPRQLHSGSWTLQLCIEGRRISVTEPTRDACLARALAVKEGLLQPVDRSQKPTLRTCIDRYIDVRSNVLSPSTIRGYRAIQHYRFPAAMDRPITAYDATGWQRLVDQESKAVSAKTLQNSWRFISSVIREETGIHYSPRLPQVVADERPYLTPEQLPVFLSAIHGSRYEIAALLALCSLRCSELLALHWQDVDLQQGLLRVHGAKVLDEHQQLVLKAENKNRSSRRLVPIMIPQLRDALAAARQPDGLVVPYYPNSVRKGINRACASADLPQVGMHGLRHSFASLAYHLQLPEKVAMEIGGWQDDATMRRIYTHVSQQDRLQYASQISKFFGG